MTEQIRAEQTAQGYEPCFGTTRLFQEEWVVKNCVECTYRKNCLKEIHSIIVTIHSGASTLPFSEQCRMMEEAKNSQVINKIAALAIASMSGPGIGGQVPKGKKRVKK